MGLWVCPEPECARIGNAGSSCPTHDKPMVRHVYRREVVPAEKKFYDRIGGIIDSMPDGPLKDTLKKQAKEWG
jgi:hypothetical protein